MRSRTSVLTSSLAFLYFVGIVGRSALAMEETPASSMNLQHYNNMLSPMAFDDTVPEKRAYTYVSEYKRLPVYNFGIGKRWIDTNDNKRGRDYSFGLGKRRQYSFGLGKRNDNTDYPLRLNLDYLPVDNPAFHSQENTDDFLEEKRGRQPYSFGLGKRAVHYSGGQPLGSKRPNDMLSQRYHFGLGKRMSEDEEESSQ
ncbi:allatostatins [Apis cerana]|uniref:Allatostatin n=1 Tax=Apis cerana cerana TaxID=94128 RepID=A0A2A3ESW5_APICC|nr:allatostatins [Apis cerana]PBC34787.1 Allatostatin [Apis cerana cerana]